MREQDRIEMRILKNEPRPKRQYYSDQDALLLFLLGLVTGLLASYFLR